jgi:hypothetical protein
LEETKGIHHASRHKSKFAMQPLNVPATSYSMGRSGILEHTEEKYFAFERGNV